MFKISGRRGIAQRNNSGNIKTSLNGSMVISTGLRSNSKNSERSQSLNKTHLGTEVRPHSMAEVMKSSRLPFIVYRTTSKDPRAVMSELFKAMMINRITYKQVGPLSS